MNQKTPKKFKTIYYIVQTTPVLKTCGQTFSPEVAEKLAIYVGQVTGAKAKIIQFTREELKELNYNTSRR
jgi:hypothetical protein